MGDIRYDFDGRNVLVTGASRGIGFAIAEAFADAGAAVSILADDPETEAAAARIADAVGRPVGALRCDIADADRVAAALAGAERIDVLVNNAGLETMTPIDAPGAEAEAAFRRIVEINVVGTYLVTRAALPRLAEGGRLLVTASIWARTAVAGFSAYCASKHANLGFVRSLARELAPRRITVNAVCPGWVRTDAALRSLAAMSRRSGRPEAELLAEISAGQILPGLMTAEDVAPLYLFLASDAARNVTGQAWHVDRGEVPA